MKKSNNLAACLAPSETISLSAAAKRIGCTPARLRQLINRGDGPAFLDLAGITRFRVRSIDTWMTKRERKSHVILKENRQLVRKFNGSPRSAVRADMQLRKRETCRNP